MKLGVHRRTDTSQYKENKINKGETGVMRLLCDSEDTLSVLGRATTQHNC